MIDWSLSNVSEHHTYITFKPFAVIWGTNIHLWYSNVKARSIIFLQHTLKYTFSNNA